MHAWTRLLATANLNRTANLPNAPGAGRRAVRPAWSALAWVLIESGD